MRPRARALAFTASALLVLAGPVGSQDVAWETRLDRGLAAPLPAYALGLVTAPGGGVYSAAASSATGYATKTFLTQLDANAAVLWSKTSDLGVPGQATAGALASDATGNTLFAFSGSTGSGDLKQVHSVASFDAAGALRWKRYVTDGVRAAVADAQGRFALVSATRLSLMDGQGVLLWTRDLAAPNTPPHLVLDTAGRFCVGYSLFPPTASVGVECYDDAGVLQWRRTYDAGSADPAMSPRPGGGVLLGGNTWDGMHYGARVLAVAGTGDVAWGLTYAADPSHDYWASRVSSLPSGDVFVAIQESWASHARPVVLRLDAAGALLYERPLDLGVETGNVTGLEVDASGNAYLTLGAGPYFGPLQAMTVRLDTAGALIWSRTYGPDPTFYTSATDLLVPSAGGAFVQTQTTTGAGDLVTTTLHYSAAGVLDLTLAPPAAGLDEEGWFASVDGLGRLIAAGTASSASSGNDVLVSAIDSSGSVVWSRTPVRGGVSGLATDRLGDIFLVHDSFPREVMKLSSEGLVEWTVPFGQAVEPDDDGGAFIGAIGVYNWALSRYSPGGNLLWAHYDTDSLAGGPVVRQDGAGGLVAAVPLARQGSGYFRTDARILRLTGSGALSWDTTLANPEQDSDLPKDIAVDAAGHTYVAVLSRRQDLVLYTVLDSSLGLIKLDPEGKVEWSRSAPAGLPTPHLPNLVTAKVVLDGRGHVCLAGSRKTGALGEILLVCYDGAGNVAWQRAFDAGGSGAEFSGALAVDDDGSLYVGGMAHDGPAVDFLVVKYDSAGNQVSAHRFDRAKGFDAAGALATGFGGAVYAVGTSWAEATQRDLEAIRYGTPPAPLRFHTLTPCRVLDTRTASGGAPVASGARLVVDVAGSGCGVPVTARAVAGNLVAVLPSSAGHLVIHPAGKPTSFSSTLNYSAGQIRSTNVTAGLAQGGRLVIRPFQGGGVVHLVFDVAGYFE